MGVIGLKIKCWVWDELKNRKGIKEKYRKGEIEK
jgi:hypothetical protein